jgi:hypothetical protein
VDEDQEGMQDQMQEQTHHEEVLHETFSSRASLWGAAVLTLVLAFGLWGIAYGYRQGAVIKQLESNQAELNATIGEIQSQLNTVASKLADVSVAQTAATEATEAANNPAVKRAAAQRAAADATRWRQMQSRLEQQQRQLKETQDDVVKTRSDLEGNLNSTRDDLNGSIARTHDELVALEKRGERNYFEFDLVKTKQFQRSGPVMLSLRKADEKHQHLDLAMIVNDNSLTKKNVNLYEPVWIYDTDSTPVQVVVNKIGKDRVHGYVSAPKYSAELAAGAAPGSSLSPTSNASPNPNASVPLQ